MNSRSLSPWYLFLILGILSSCNSPSQDTNGGGTGTPRGPDSTPTVQEPLPTPSASIPTPTISSSPIPVPYPSVRGQDFHGDKNFAYLINHYLQGKTEPTPWAGFWWPYTGNGIAAGTFNGFMGGGSPAGKYDAARGNSTHAQLWEIKNHGAGVPRVQQWWGHCNGWCAASALFPEPHEAVTVNGIDFGIGDIKALLTEAGMSVNADFYGERVDVDDQNSPKYWDTVPDQYFLVLSNYIGKLKQAVLIDRYTGSQIWNQPLAGYRFEYPTPSDYLGNSTDAPDVYRIMVTSTLWWLDDGVAPDVQTHVFNYEDEDPTGVIQSRTLKMEVWLDAPVVFDATGKITQSGDVIVSRKGDYVSGGAWRMGDGYYVDAWPDYMWIPYALIKPADPEQDYVNPEVDPDWIKAHILAPGGVDDPSVNPGNITPAPLPSGMVPWPVNSGSPWPGTAPWTSGGTPDRGGNPWPPEPSSGSTPHNDPSSGPWGGGPWGGTWGH